VLAGQGTSPALRGLADGPGTLLRLQRPILQLQHPADGLVHVGQLHNPAPNDAASRPTPRAPRFRSIRPACHLAVIAARCARPPFQLRRTFPRSCSARVSAITGVRRSSVSPAWAALRRRMSSRVSASGGVRPQNSPAEAAGPPISGVNSSASFGCTSQVTTICLPSRCRNVKGVQETPPAWARFGGQKSGGSIEEQGVAGRGSVLRKAPSLPSRIACTKRLVEILGGDKGKTRQSGWPFTQAGVDPPPANASLPVPNRPVKDEWVRPLPRRPRSRLNADACATPGCTLRPRSR